MVKSTSWSGRGNELALTGDPAHHMVGGSQQSVTPVWGDPTSTDMNACKHSFIKVNILWFAYMYVNFIHAWCPLGSEEGIVLEVVSHHIGTGNWTGVRVIDTYSGYTTVWNWLSTREACTGLENNGHGPSQLCKLLSLTVGKAVKGFQLNHFLKVESTTTSKQKARAKAASCKLLNAPQILGVCLVEESVETEKSAGITTVYHTPVKFYVFVGCEDVLVHLWVGQRSISSVH